MKKLLSVALLTWALSGQAGLPEFFITPGVTGSYATFDGQGINVEVLAQNGVIVVYWYTFDPDTGELLWLVGAGLIDQNRAEISFTRVSDGVFNSGAPVTRDNSYATGTIIFESCTDGRIEFNIPAASVSGSVDFSRITPDHLCLSGGVGPAATIFNGTWEGMWNNDTFGSSGGLSFDIDVNLNTGMVTIMVDIDGNAFGLPDPDPVTVTGMITEDGIVIDDDSDLGSADIVLDDDGTFTATLTNDFGVVEVSGTFSPVHMAGDYTVLVEGEVLATGTTYANKTGD